MSKRIWWMLGEQQAGKSYLTKMIRTYGGRVLLIGEELAKDRELLDFAKERNPYAAPSVEQQVQEMILTTISDFLSDSNTTHDLLVIDSAPKNMDQHKITLAHARISTVFFIRENADVRRLRAMNKYNGDLTLFDARESHEQSWLKFFLEMCKVSGIDHIILDKRTKKS